MAEREIDLIARVAIYRDHQAFARLVEMHQSSVRGLLLRLTGGDGALADDLAQTTFVLAHAKIGHYRASGRFSSWLYRIAYNSFLQALRRRGRRREVPLDQAPAEPGGKSFALARIDIERAMAGLSAPERAAVTLCLSLGYSHAEACAVMDIPLGTLKSHVARGKAKLRVALSPWHSEVSR